jgi:hypothetical protein
LKEFLMRPLAHKTFVGWLFGIGVLLCSAGLASAQTITYPQADQAVRGTVRALFEGIPADGHAMVYLDGRGLQNWRESTNLPYHTINTFALADGPHTLTIVVFNGGGRRIGQAEVKFEVANTRVDVSAEGVRLRNWTNADINQDAVRRYRVFAESNAVTDTGAAGGEGAAADAAPLDWQLDILVRRVVRDVGLYGDAANIQSTVSEAYQRQRGQAAGAEGGITTTAAPTIAPGGKPDWGMWVASPQTGKYGVKTIRQNGDEINATRKPASLGIADLLPRFPTDTVRPGSTWETQMTIVGEIPEAEPVNISAPMTFTGFENIQTPAGVEKRTAKLESRFNLPLEAATRIARSIHAKNGASGAAGASAGGGEATEPAPTAGGAASAAVAPVNFKTVRVSVSREIWFDIAGNQVLRSNDAVRTFYEVDVPVVAAAVGAPGEPGMEAGGGGAPATPPRVTYNLRISKYLDDTVPPPSDSFNAGAGTAHARDNVQDPSIGRLLQGSR